MDLKALLNVKRMVESTALSLILTKVMQKIEIG